jgi:hypothetical protein
MFWLKKLRIFGYALAGTIVFVSLKWIAHLLGFEVIAQSSLHNSLVSSAIFVIGFVMSATIADYKESERIPADFASAIENMYEDAREIHKTYPNFDIDLFRKELIDILAIFREGTRAKRKGTRREISELNATFGQMEKAGVPPNFVVKLKQQQTVLLRHVYRVNYIQRIQFIPSSTVLVRSITIFVLVVLLFTNVDPYYAGLIITGVISFVLLYMVLLIQTINVPFKPSGESVDDVSLFLLNETKEYLQSRSRNEKNDV